jgi:tRNA A37 threonylcarbamoyladenosine dehydratase
VNANNPIWERTEILIGADGCARLADSHVFLAGLGGVGSFAAEALARAGVGSLTLADFDVVAPSNLNRQLCALGTTVGER